MRDATLVLAAGASTRLGQPKQLLTYEGETLLARTVRIARETCGGPIFVVTGAHADGLHPALQLADAALHNPAWEQGIGSSIAFGISRVLANAPDTENVRILLCDQPGIPLAFHRQLLALHHAARPPAAAAFYAGKPGVPAIFSRSMFPDLQSLAGDAGAGRLLAATSGVLTLACPEAEFDVDTPEDAARLSALP